jgi:arsenite-transporting ATPase
MENLDYLDNLRPKIVIFSGKGGVGKTTCAAATALHFAQENLSTLLISTDPTPSLSDILEENVRTGITRIRKVKNLEAVELDYDRVIENWKKKFGPEVYEVISSFLPVGEGIIDYVAGAPGIDEEYALAYLLEIYEKKQYEVIVWDTAPAGGTLSLLRLQEKFYEHLSEAAALYLRLKRTLAKLTGGKERSPLHLIREWRKLAGKILTMVKDEETHTIIVTIPEALGVNQTERIIKELGNFSMSISKIIINFVLTEELCECTFHQQKREIQKKYLHILQDKYCKTPGLVILADLPNEVKGIDGIRKIENLLFKTV